MLERLSAVVRLLSDEHLVWSKDFDAVRLPLARLLARVEQLPSHALDEEVEALLDALQPPVPADSLEAWLTQNASAIGAPAAEALRRMFR
jgi:hypothetical protein